MKSKPKISKQNGSWVVTREGFGFAQAPVTTERRTHSAAIQSLGEINVGFASAERTSTPEPEFSYMGKQPNYWPAVIR